jgi:hypothetical protein
LSYERVSARHEFPLKGSSFPGTARPRAGKLAFHFVSLKLRMKGIGREEHERRLQFRPELRVLLNETPGGTNKCLRREQQPFQARMRLTI